MIGTLLTAAIACALIGGAAIAVTALSVALPNPWRVFRDYGSPHDFGLSPERISIDGRVPAWFFAHAEAREVVLVCHGRSRGKAFELPLVARLARDFAVLVFDFPGHGETPYRWTTIGWSEAEVVTRALRFLEERGCRRIFVYGVSQGGAAVIRAIANERGSSVRAVAVDGTFADLGEMLRANGRRLLFPAWLTHAAIALAGRLAGYDPLRFRPVADIARIDRPMLVLHGESDPLVPPASARRLAAAAPRATLRTYPGRHDEPHNPHMQEALVAFFAGLERAGAKGEARSPTPPPDSGGAT